MGLKSCRIKNLSWFTVYLQNNMNLMASNKFSLSEVAFRNERVPVEEALIFEDNCAPWIWQL